MSASALNTRRLARLQAGQHSPCLATLLKYVKARGKCMDAPGAKAFIRNANDGHNPAIATAINPLHAAGKPIFFAVGAFQVDAFHLGRPHGLAALLEAKGYKVMRVAFSV